MNVLEKIKKYGKPIVNAHKDNIAMARKIMKMTGLARDGMYYVSVFWLACLNDSVMDEPGMMAASLRDVAVTMKCDYEIDKHLFEAQDFYYMLSSWRRRTMTWVNILTAIVIFEVQRLENAMGRTQDANDAFYKEFGDRIEMLKAVCVSLGFAQSKIIQLNSTRGVGLPGDMDMELSRKLREIVEYLGECGIGPEDGLRTMSMSFDDMIKAGLSEEEAVEFVSRFATIGDEAIFERLELAVKTGRLADFVREMLRS